MNPSPSLSARFGVATCSISHQTPDTRRQTPPSPTPLLLGTTPISNSNFQRPTFKPLAKRLNTTHHS